MGLDIPSSYPYASSISSSASSSCSSVFSVDAASQSSLSSTTSSVPSTWESEEWSRRSHMGVTPIQAVCAPISRVSTYPQYQPAPYQEVAPLQVLAPLRTDLALPADQRRHPRRSATTINQRAPPALVHQSERKTNFVDCLVDSATQMVEVIWPLSVPSVPSESASGRGVLPLRTFIQETLRRSRTSYSTLQVALYYLVLIKEHVPKHDFTMEQPEDVQSLRALQCGRRMFLAALILASKYLQDRNFSARAWSKISSLQVCEINSNEIAFLSAVNWKLHITEPVWERWQEVVLRHAPSNPPSSPGACVPNSWKDIIPHLTPELDMAGIAPRTPVTPAHAEFKPEIRRSPLRYTLPLPLPDASSSAESTPTPAHYQAPRFLEPKPDLLPPTPSLIRMGPLPTPLLTPQSIASSTPAASVLGLGSRRPSMCTAMAQAQSSSLARLCVDQFNPSAKNGLEEYHFPSRRPSLAPSTSSTSSSPESMVTDNSRSSRASSISSVSSAGCAPNPAKLARLATCRSARLQYPALQKCPEASEYSSPDLESFHIDDADVSPSFKAHGTADSVSAISRQARKRGISSVDMQQQVRQLLQRSTSTTFSEDKVVRDQCDAVSFMLQDLDEPKGLQFPARTVSESRVPIQKDLGRKRTCCGSSAVPSNNWQQLVHSGPGMWQGIL